MEEEAIERLEAKSPKETMIARIVRDFDLAPPTAGTDGHPGPERRVGEMTFLAVSADAPPGRALAACEQVAVNLTLDSPDDLNALRQGVASLRRRKIQRFTREAQDQGALLTQEDLARLLCCSRSTIKRDIAHLRAEGVDVPTRGQMQDVGRGVSHKTLIVRDWLGGYSFSEIERRRRQALGSIKRYCRDYQRVTGLHTDGLTVEEIRVATGLSARLVQEYLDLQAEREEGD